MKKNYMLQGEGWRDDDQGHKLGQYTHYYETTYSLAYNSEEKRPLNISLSGLSQGRCFPGHQPELDPLYGKYEPISTYRQDFQNYQQNVQVSQEGEEAGLPSRSSSSK